jgi:hypothetical protein
MHPGFMKIDWTKGLLRLWLVASLLWAVPIGYLIWPGERPGETIQDCIQYWIDRVEIARDAWQTRLAMAKIQAQYDAIGKQRSEMTAEDGTSST